MVEQDLSRKKMYPLAMKVYLPGTETVRSDHFLFLEKVSLSSVSAQKDCLTSLRCLPSLRSGRQPLRSVRQPVLLPYDLGKWNFLAEKKTGPHFRSVPGIHFPRPGEYIFLPLTCEETDSKVMTPSVTLAGTQSTSIQKDTQEMATIKIEGK